MTIDPTMAVRSRRRVERRQHRRRRCSERRPTGRQGLRLDALAARSSRLGRRQTRGRGGGSGLATGQATDPTAVVMAVERAQLAMQMASQIRTKAVEAAQTIFQTQV